jgi:hypothetical protein
MFATLERQTVTVTGGGRAEVPREAVNGKAGGG